MLLRKIESSDASPLHSLFLPDKATSYMDLPIAAFSLFERWLNELMAAEFLGMAEAKVILTEAGEMAGLIVLHSIDWHSKTAEMGTWLGQGFRGQGYNERAKSDMLTVAFEKHGLDTVLLFTAEQNIASKKALEKLPYVSAANLEHYFQELKRKEFLYRQKFLIYEVKKNDFLG